MPTQEPQPVLPFFHNLGLEVLDERPFEIETADHRDFFLYDLGPKYPAEVVGSRSVRGRARPGVGERGAGFQARNARRGRPLQKLPGACRGPPCCPFGARARDALGVLVVDPVTGFPGALPVPFSAQLVSTLAQPLWLVSSLKPDPEGWPRRLLSDSKISRGAPLIRGIAPLADARRAEKYRHRWCRRARGEDPDLGLVLVGLFHRDRRKPTAFVVGETSRKHPARKPSRGLARQFGSGYWRVSLAVRSWSMPIVGGTSSPVRAVEWRGAAGHRVPAVFGSSPA
ncbi:hypothetical protein ACRAWF_04245 [Streptomyces sp. L7]